MKKPVKENTLLDGAIFVACVTTFFYFADFNYEAGRMQFYRVPTSLIEVNINSILTSSVALYTLVISMMIMTYILHVLHKSLYDLTEIKSFFISLIVMQLLAACAFIFADFDIKTAIKKFVTSITIDIFCAFLYYLGKRFYSNKSNEHDLDVRHNYFLKCLIILVFGITLSAVSFGIGYIQSKKSQSYMITGKTSNIVILTKTGDLLIAKPFNLQTMKLSDSIMFFKISERDNPILIQKDLQFK